MNEIFSRLVTSKLIPLYSYLHDVDETEERMNKQLAEAAKRENVLVLRLSAREQELQDVAAVAVKYRQQQVKIKFLKIYIKRALFVLS